MTLRHDVAPTDVSTILAMSRTDLDKADQVITFNKPVVSGEPEVVVELRDLHRNLLGRTVVVTDAAPTEVAERLLAEVRLDRCSDYLTDPLGRTKVRRTVASVCPAAAPTVSTYERERTGALRQAI